MTNSGNGATPGEHQGSATNTNSNRVSVPRNPGVHTLRHALRAARAEHRRGLDRSEAVAGLLRALSEAQVAR